MAQHISTIDIILRKIRNSQLPFGGVLIFGSMDNEKIQPINQLPFLTSTLVMTCFEAFGLRHSVRAHGDPDFQCLQNITQMCPFKLRGSNELKNDFFNLAEKIFTFVPNWNNSRITPNIIRVFSRIRPAQEAINEYREKIKRLLDNESIPYISSYARDLQRSRSTNAEFSNALGPVIKSLKKELKEPVEIVFF